ncbi:MAG: T9SS type A sorting domain-containing protein [Acidaminococcaceae bacterium]|jgi:hypothetical protein
MENRLLIKTNFVILLSVLFFYAGYSQIEFGAEQIIEQESGFVHVHTGDLDGDGDEDVIACRFGKLIWYENDGLGNFVNTQIIVEEEGSMQSIYIIDLDGDNDLDILTESNQDYGENDQIVWFNNDGLGNFSTKIIISDQVDAGHCVFAADLDGDEDNDVLSASVYDDKIAWYENDGNGNFGIQQIISSTTEGASTVYASDIDGDGDNDILSGGAWDNTLSWYENIDGQGTFGPENYISTTVDLIQFAYTADLDGDSDQDVYFAAMGNNKIAWYQNDGSGNFGSQHLIDFVPDATDVFAQDFDNDYDLDIVSTADNGFLSWYENNGFGEFGEQIIISNMNNRSVYAADINGDNKYDILTASFYEEKLSWYKNMGTVGINENPIADFSFYPNPAKKDLIIQSNSIIKELKIINLSGQNCLYFTNMDNIDISDLNSGIYYIEIVDINGKVRVKKLVKE